MLAGVASVSPACAETASWTALIVGDSTSSNALAPIEVAGDKPGTPIPAGNNPFAIAVGPDGSTAYVADYNSNGGGEDGVTKVNLAESPPHSSFIPTDPSGGTFKPLSLAVAPDGRALWAVYPPTGKIEKIDLSGSTPTVGEPFSDGSSEGAETIAISPDGRTAWVVDEGEGQVTPIDLTSDPPQPQTPIRVGRTPSNADPFGIGVSPDGSKVFVADLKSNELSVIDTATREVTNVALPGGEGSEHAYALTVSPDGSTVWVSQPVLEDVVPVDVSGPTPKVGTPIPIDFAGDVMRGGHSFPEAIAITPDGSHLYVGNGYFAPGGRGPFGEEAVDVSLPSGTQTPIFTPGVQTQRGAAVTPDQAPIANFSVAPAAAGQATSFDASSSSVAVGTIARYEWSFGDGATEVTSSPTTTHVYALNGTYTATVTETDSAGTSTTPVYTGQSMLRDGGPSAQASKSVIVNAQPQPAVTVSATGLDFGAVGVGQTGSAKLLTLTNSGAAPLIISSAALGGSEPRDFELLADACAGHTLAVGASCTTSIAFAPQASGPRSAQLAFADDASGSPQTIALTGVGSEIGSVSGKVLDAAEAGDPPVAHAQVQICPQGELGVSACQYTETGADGAYSFSNVAPGAWAMEALPGGDLLSGSAVVHVVPGNQTQDFLLRRPSPPPAGISFAGTVGTGPEGMPVFNWDEPASIVWPLYLPRGKPGETVQLTDETSLSTSAGQLLAQTTLPLTVTYGANGQGTVTAVGTATSAVAHAGAVAGAAAGSLRARAAGSGGGGPSIADTFQQIFNSLNPVNAVNAVVQSVINLLKQDHGTTEANNQTQQDAKPGPSGVYECPPDTATVHWRKEYQQQIATGSKTSGETTYKWVCVPEPRGCEAKASRVEPAHASSRPTDASSAPAPPSAEGETCEKHPDVPSVPVPMVFDPSGTVLTPGGAPVPGAKVVLSRAGTSAGPFSPVPNGSPMMSVSNRRNPDRTSAVGAFHWDVVAGYYRVSAEHAGCRAAHGRARSVLTPVLPVPPPRFGLRLVLRCPRLHRARSSLRLLASTKVKGLVQLSARVRTRSGHAPAGLVQFLVGARVLATTPVNAKGEAMFSLPRRGLSSLRARYLGDGYDGPSSAGASRRR